MSDGIENEYIGKTDAQPVNTNTDDAAANDKRGTRGSGISPYPQELEYDSLGQIDDTDSMGQPAKSVGMPSDEEMRWIK